MSVPVDQHRFMQSMLGQTKAALIAWSCCLFQLIASKGQYLSVSLISQSPWYQSPCYLSSLPSWARESLRLHLHTSCLCIWMQIHADTLWSPPVTGIRHLGLPTNWPLYPLISSCLMHVDATYAKGSQSIPRPYRVSTSWLGPPGPFGSQLVLYRYYTGIYQPGIYQGWYLSLSISCICRWAL